eukprot:14565138-Alexandrium_andersonii.AAC.1
MALPARPRFATRSLSRPQSHRRSQTEPEGAAAAAEASAQGTGGTCYSAWTAREAGTAARRSAD